MRKGHAMKKILVLLGLALVTVGASAEPKPFQLSLTPALSLYGRNEKIEGFTLGIWSENPQAAFALGFVNGSTGDSAGLSVGILNYADNYRGLQWGLVNYTKGDTLGWQGGFCLGLVGSVVNYTGGTMKGFQCGVVNYAHSLNGLQLGLVNYSEVATSGVQIGVVNIMPQNQWFTELPDELAPAMVLVNWHF